MSYEEQLLTPQWKAKREEILERDWRMCQKCMSGKNLDVHHLYYIPGKKAWEHYNSGLITLCRTCHAEVHASPMPQPSGLDQALDKLVHVAQGVRDWCVKQLPDNG